jgi:hypothetical protein
MTPEDLVTDVCPRIGAMGSAFYRAPVTGAKAEELGLAKRHFYFLGRGGVLGNVEPAVVASAFGYFNPSLIDEVWRAGSAVVEPRVAGRAFMECCGAFGRERFAGVAGLDAFCAAAGAVADAADPAGLALFAGVASEPLADDAPARALQLVATLREYRGSAHLVAVRVAGLDPKTAHFMRRPNDGPLFGWPEEERPEIGDEEVARLADADGITDRLVRPAYAVLDDEGQQALRAGLDGMEAALATRS